jgi:hypothetical protein
MKKLAITILCISFAISSLSQERSELRKNSPNRIVLNVGGGVFSNYTYTEELPNSWKDPKFRMGNVTYSGMLGYRSGFNSNNYKFSSTGRDANRGNVVALFYQTGRLNDVGLGELEKNEKKIFFESIGQDVRFTELQVGVVWREFLRISGGKGSVKTLKTLNDYTDLENVDYHLFTAGVNLRFGRLCPTLNWTLMSADNFETTMSRFDIQICMNMYFWKKILHKDKHLITE